MAKITIESEGKVSTFDLLPPEGYGAGPDLAAVDWAAILKALTPIAIPLLQALINYLQKQVGTSA